MKIIDTHVHLGDIYNLFPNFSFEERNADTTHPGKLSVYERMGFRNIYFGKLNYLFKPLIAKSAKSITKYANLPNLLESMEKSVIQQSIVLALEPNVMTESILEVCRNNEHLIPFCSVHPFDKNKKEKIKKYIRAGCRGLKLHPVIQNVRPDDNATFELLEEIRTYDIPVLFHTGWGSIGSGSYGFLENYKKLLIAFPKMTFIFAHMGFYEPFPFLDLIEKHDKVYCDTSWQPPNVILRAIDKLGENRIMFGTDWPYALQSTSLNIVLKITENKPELKEKILYKNAAQIINVL